jgi:hypothetical protein
MLGEYGVDDIRALLEDATPEQAEAIADALQTYLPAPSPMRMWAELDWEPQPKQALAETLIPEVDELLYGGAAGGGKSEWLLAHAVSEMMRHPGNRGVIFRRVLPAAERSIIPRAEVMLFNRARMNRTDKSFTFDNGSILEFGHLEHLSSWSRFQGAELGFIGFEEVTEFVQEQWENMRTRCRAPVPGVHAHMAATTNPGGVGHRWVKRRWVKPKPEDMADPEAERPLPGEIWEAKHPEPGRPPTRRVFVPATLADNPILTTRDPGYMDRLAATANRAMRRAMELGDWDAIDQIEGALWNWEWIEQERRDPNILRNTAGGMGLVHVVVGVDPAGTSNENSDDTGIVVAGRGRDGHYYVLADRTCHLSPDGWGRVAVEAYHEFQADRIVAEVNYGGDMVIHTIRTVDQRVPVTAKNAGARGKRLRAEPISALYEQRKVHHCGVFEELEEQQTSWTAESGDSPDRLDALVWAMTDLSAGVQVGRGKQDRSGVLRGTR